MDFKFPLQIDSAGKLVTVDGVEETKQRAYIALKSGQGEWDFDQSFGVPWRQLMSQRPHNLGAVRAAITRQLLRVPGMDSVDDIQLTTDEATRELSVLAKCTASGVSIEVKS
jgi:hypothetical protein